MRPINILGYMVRVAEVERVDAEIEGIDGEFIQSDTNPKEPTKYFGVIRVDKSLTHKKKRLVVLHELVHALNDIFWDEAHKK